MNNTEKKIPLSNQEVDPIPDKYHFDKNDDFYMAPPTCHYLHYRHAAIMVGIMEIILLFSVFYSFYVLYVNGSTNGIGSLISIFIVCVIASITTTIMIYGITTEKPQLLLPQIAFLHVEITLLLLGAAGAIASMSLGIEWTHSIFAPFVSISHMELNFGPIWPFNVAIVSFSGAALGIWFHVIVQGCYDYLLDQKYFEEKIIHSQPHSIQLQMR